MDEKSAAITEVELTPGSAISVSDLKQDLTNLTPEYTGMLSHIEETLPATNAAVSYTHLTLPTNREL